MFTKEDSGLVFVKSTNINIFPCGRRKGQIAAGANTSYVPFDPEARLNTEANNRKHSGLNGFTQSFVDSWKAPEGDGSGKLTLVIAGYFFEITLENDYKNVNDFGTKLKDLLGGETTNIFVNIQLADVELFSEDKITSVTKILRDQISENQPVECLDIPKGTVSDINNFYFYGLSFSNEDYSEKNKKDLNGQNWHSLQLLDFDDENWVIHEPSRLPKVYHGDTTDSTVLPGDLQLGKDKEGNPTGALKAAHVEANTVILRSGPAVVLKVEDLDDNTSQLQFFIEPLSN